MSLISWQDYMVKEPLHITIFEKKTFQAIGISSIIIVIIGAILIGVIDFSTSTTSKIILISFIYLIVLTFIIFSGYNLFQIAIA